MQPSDCKLCKKLVAKKLAVLLVGSVISVRITAIVSIREAECNLADLKRQLFTQWQDQEESGIKASKAMQQKKLFD